MPASPAAPAHREIIEWLKLSKAIRRGDACLFAQTYDKLPDEVKRQILHRKGSDGRRLWELVNLWRRHDMALRLYGLMRQAGSPPNTLLCDVVWSKDLTAGLIGDCVAEDAFDPADSTVIWRAALEGEPDTLTLLVEAGASAHSVSTEYRIERPLILATAMSVRPDLLVRLIELGTDARATDNVDEGCAHYAARMRAIVDRDSRAAACARLPAYLDVLLKAGVSIDAATFEGNTALHFAAEDGCGPAVTALLNAGANPLVRNDDHKTPADTAREHHHPETEMLIAAWCARRAMALPIDAP